jgi:signal peptidase II
MPDIIARNSKNLFLSAGLLGLALFIADRILKNLVLAEKIFGVKNFGLALSVGFGGKIGEIIFWVIAGIIIFLLAYLIIKEFLERRSLLLITYYLLFLGSASNLLDRLKFGYVIDYFNFHFFYNNLADIIIWLGIIIYLIRIWYNKNKTQNPDSRTQNMNY